MRRWSRNAGLAWSDEDVVEVARYLNALYYQFAVPSVTGRERDRVPRSVARAN